MASNRDLWEDLYKTPKSSGLGGNDDLWADLYDDETRKKLQYRFTQPSAEEMGPFLPEEDSPSFFGAVAPSVETAARTAYAGGIAAGSAAPSRFFEGTSTSPLDLALPPLALGETISRELLRPFFEDDAERLKKAGQEAFKSELPGIAQSSKRAQDAIAALGDSPIKQWGAQTVADAAASATSYAPLIGGGLAALATRGNPAAVSATTKALATLPAAQAYTSAYLQAKQQGKSDEFAHDYALAQSGAEYLFEAAAPGGGKTIMGTIGKRLAYEVLSEGGTQGIQDLIDRAILPEVASQSGEEAASNIARAGSAALLGGSIGSVIGARSATEGRLAADAEKARQDRELADQIDAELGGLGITDPTIREAKIVAETAARRASEEADAVINASRQAFRTGLEERRKNALDNTDEEGTRAPRTPDEDTGATTQAQRRAARERAQPGIRPIDFSNPVDIQDRIAEIESKQFPSIEDITERDNLQAVLRSLPSDPAQTGIDFGALEEARTQRERDALTERSRPIANANLVQDLFSGNLSTVVTPEERALREEQGRLPEVQAELERDYAFRQREREAERQRQMPPSTDVTDLGVSGLVQDAINQGRSPTMAAAFEQAGLRRTGGSQLTPDALTPEQIAQRASLQSEIEKARQALEKEDSAVPPRISAQEDTLTKALDEAYQSNDDVRIAKAEKALDDFYKNSKVAQKRSNTREKLNSLESQLANLNRSISEAYTLQSVYPDIRGGQASQRTPTQPNRTVLPTDEVQQDLAFGNVEQPAQTPQRIRTRGEVAANPPPAPPREVPIQREMALTQNVPPPPPAGTARLRTAIGKEVQSEADIAAQRLSARLGEAPEVTAPATTTAPTQDTQQSPTEQPVTQETPEQVVTEAPIDEQLSQIRTQNEIDKKVARVRESLSSRNLADVDVYYAPPKQGETGVTKGRFNINTGKLELNAAALDDDADIAAVAVHEINHALNQAKDQGVEISRRDLTSVIGSDKRAVVNNRIRALATSYPEMARAVQRAKQAGDRAKNAEIGEIELLSYALEEITKARESGKNLGPRLKTFVKDMVAEIKGFLARVGTKNKTLLDLSKSFNENDLYRLGKVMMKEYASGTRPLPQKSGGTLESRTTATDSITVNEGKNIVKYNGVNLGYDVEGNKVNLYKVNVPRDLRGKGAARQALQVFVSEMDKAGKTVELDAIPQSADTNEADLVRLYESVGFKVTEIVNDSPRMVREPATVLESRGRPAQPKEVDKVRDIAGKPIPDITTRRGEVVDTTGVKKVTEGMVGTSKKLSEGKTLKDRIKAFADGLGGKPLELGEIEVTADAALESARLKAAQARERLNASILKDVPKKNRPEVLRAISSVLNSKDPDLRQQAIDTLDSKYPNTAKAYKDFRNRIDNFSIQYIDFILNSGKALTQSDVDRLKAIQANMGSYVTRNYKAFANDSKVKDNYLKGLQKGYDQYKKTGLMNPEAQIWINARDYLIDANLQIGAYLGEMDKAPKGMRGVALSRTMAMADMWLGDEGPALPPSGATPDQIETYVDAVNEALAKKREELDRNGTYQNQLEEKADRLVGKILGVIGGAKSEDPFLIDYRPTANDMTTLMKRSNYAEPIRALLGEITDPVVQLENTLLAQSQFLANARRQQELYVIGKEKEWFVDEATADAKTYTKQIPNTDTYGPLAGRWTTQEIFDVLVETESLRTSWQQLFSGNVKDAAKANILASNVVNALGSMNSLSKAVRIKYNPFNWMTNFLGATVMTPLLNGYSPVSIFSPVESLESVYKAVRASGGQLFADQRQNMNAFAQEIIEAGLGDQVNIAELQEQIRRERREEVETGRIKTGALRKVSEAATWASAQSDKVAIYGVYFREKAELKRYYDAKGESLTEDQLRRRTAERIRQSNITPERALGLLTSTEKLGLTTYMRYFYETIRSSMRAEIVALGDVSSAIQDFKSGNAKAGRIILARGLARAVGAAAGISGAQAIVGSALRLGSQGAWLAALGGAGYLAAAMASGEDWEEDDIVSKILPGLDLEKQGKMFALLNTTKEGTYQLFELDRFNPVDPASALVYSAVAFAKTGDVGYLERLQKEMTGMIIENAATVRAFEGLGMVLEGIGLKKDKDELPPGWSKTNKEAYETAITVVANTAAEVGINPNTARTATDVVLRQLEPYTPVRPFITLLNSYFQSDEAQKLKIGQSVGDTLKGVGASVVEYNPLDKIVQTARFDYSTAIQQNANDFYNQIETLKEFSPKAIELQYVNAVKRQKEEFDRISTPIAVALDLGIKKPAIIKALKDAKVPLNENRRNDLLNNRFRPEIYNPASYRRAMEAAMLKEKNASRKKEIKRRFDEAEVVLRQLHKQS